MVVLAAVVVAAVEEVVKRRWAASGLRSKSMFLSCSMRADGSSGRPRLDGPLEIKVPRTAASR